MQEDATLVKQTLAGEEQAFHRLISKYQSAIYRQILSYVKNHHDAQDLAQETFLEAYRDLCSLRKPEQFQFWLRQIARHQCDDWLRKRRIELVPIQESTVADVSQADELLILRETLAKVMQAINELPEMEKRLMKERYLDDASYPELQVRYDLSSKALIMRLVRAREKVRESVRKALAGVGVLTWRKMLLGGAEAVKIGLKVKIMTIGIAGVVVLGGAGVYVWYNQAVQDISDVSNQTIQQTSQISQDKTLPVRKALNKPIKKSKEEMIDNDVSEKVDQSKETILQKAVESTKILQAEDLVQRYDKYMNSQENMDWSAKEIRPFSIERERFAKQAELLKQERDSLEEKLAAASDEERDKIQKELSKVQAEYMEAKTNVSLYQILTMDAIDRGRLRHFTPDELSEIFRLKAAASPPPPELPPPSKRESEEFSQASAEAGRRLKASGFMPNPILAKALFWD